MHRSKLFHVAVAGAISSLVAWVALLAVSHVAAAQTPPARAAEKRIALVIGNAGYPTQPLVTPANDAGLIAQTLQTAGFDVIGARDLDGEGLRQSFRDYLERARAAGPDAVAFVYFAGYGLQYTGDNFLVPIDAKIDFDIDVPVQALRLSDLLKQLSDMPLKLRMVVIDGARAHPFGRSGQPLAGGLSAVTAPTGLLVAFNAAPGTVAADGAGPYGPFAQSLAELIRDAGLMPGDVFDRVRLRVSEVSDGAIVPWHVARIDTMFEFFERAADAPPPVATPAAATERRLMAIRTFEPDDAFFAALERDRLDSYLEFLEAFPDHPQAPRIRAIAAVRREALTWWRSRRTDTTDAYWSYIERYPNGPHVADCQRRLRSLIPTGTPTPATFTRITYDLAAPAVEEFAYVASPVISFADPAYGFAPLHRPRRHFLSPRPEDFVVLPPPPPVVERHALPIPYFVPLSRSARSPRHVVQPAGNLYHRHLHDAAVVNEVIARAHNINPTSINLANPGLTHRTAGNGAPAGGPHTTGDQPNRGAAGPGAVAATAALAAVAVGLRAALPTSIARRESGQAAGRPSASPNGQPASPSTASPSTPGRGATSGSGAPAGAPRTNAGPNTAGPQNAPAGQRQPGVTNPGTAGPSGQGAGAPRSTAGPSQNRPSSAPTPPPTSQPSTRSSSQSFPPPQGLGGPRSSGQPAAPSRVQGSSPSRGSSTPSSTSTPSSGSRSGARAGSSGGGGGSSRRR